MLGRGSVGKCQDHMFSEKCSQIGRCNSQVSYLCKRIVRGLVDRIQENMLSVVLSLIHPYSNPSLSDSTRSGLRMVGRFH